MKNLAKTLKIEVEKVCDRNPITYCEDFEGGYCPKTCHYAHTVLATRSRLRDLTKEAV